MPTWGKTQKPLTHIIVLKEVNENFHSRSCQSACFPVFSEPNLFEKKITREKEIERRIWIMHWCGSLLQTEKKRSKLDVFYNYRLGHLIARDTNEAKNEVFRSRDMKICNFNRSHLDLKIDELVRVRKSLVSSCAGKEVWVQLLSRILIAFRPLFEKLQVLTR